MTITNSRNPIIDKSEIDFNRVINSTLILETSIINESQYSRDVVWENAQDLEHVATLHPKTNYKFKFLDYSSPLDKSSDFSYSNMAFITTRKILGFIPVNSVGIRKIDEKYRIKQFEYNSFLRLYTVLDSKIVINNDDIHGCKLVDEVRIFGPKIFKLIKYFISKELVSHASRQCVEDETFRKRRSELIGRQIHLPYRFLDKSVFELFFN
jgi:hypothetical protein